jgi:hypothetical protein
MHADNLYGILLGIAVGDKVMIRNSFNSLTVGVNTQIMNGFLGVFMKDIRVEKDIIKMAKKLDLDGGLVMDLLQIVNEDSQLVSSSVLNLIQDDVESPEIIASLVAMFRKDIPSSRTLAEKIGVKPSDFVPLMAAAAGKLDLM